MAKNGTVAVLLPGAFYVLRETRLPPIQALRASGVAIAVASDLNPGTSPIVSLQANMHMACTLFRLTPTEVLRGVTINAAHALGLQRDRGTLAAGMRADWCLWNVGEPAELCYWMGGVRPQRTVAAGRERK
jgi:imidazolonepropionase